MQSHHTKATVGDDGSLTINKLPFATGESVEVIVFAPQRQGDHSNPYPLRGLPIQFDDATSPVAESDWEAGK